MIAGMERIRMRLTASSAILLRQQLPYKHDLPS
jgi:hypothetical protein